MIVIIINKVAYIAFYNFPFFWRTFLAELEELDDDPVDVASHFVSKVNNKYHSRPMQKNHKN